MEVNESPWYDKKWLVAILLIVFFPVGLYALWKSNNIKQGWKVALSILVGLIVITNVMDDKKAPTDDMKADFASSTESKPNEPALTQDQKDSIEYFERESYTSDAAAIVQEYENNEVKADEMWKGKTLIIQGRVDNIGKDMMDDMYLTLEGDGMLRSVQVYIDDKNELTRLNKGDFITVKGTCDGLMMNVLIKNAEVIPNLNDLAGAAKFGKKKNR